MKYRILGKTGFKISEASLGTWQLGARWGEPFNEKVAIDTLNKAIDLGVNFIDTADMYSDGLSERFTAKVVKSRKEKIYVATKCGRKLKPHTSDGYNDKNIRRFIEDSLKNMGVDKIDLIQLHCPPTEVYYRPEVFETLDRLKEEGKILFYGVSVEKVEEALKAIEYPGLATVQIIFNCFRQRPATLFFPEAEKKNIGIIVRVPLASGLLAGKYTRDTVFEEGDHRFFNREGKYFDKGETFAGVPFDTGLEAVEQMKKIFPDQENLALYALRWILMFNEPSCIIPGASRASQAENNVRASDIAPLEDEKMQAVKELYEQYIKPWVHHLW
ncbi:MAG: aldo/keto reductase [Spirochaetota bacterium]|nr:MAG: aldo/keto reductase [Spirochaetota bacterium]